MKSLLDRAGPLGSGGPQKPLWAFVSSSSCTLTPLPCTPRTAPSGQALLHPQEWAEHSCRLCSLQNNSQRGFFPSLSRRLFPEWQLPTGSEPGSLWPLLNQFPQHPKGRKTPSEPNTQTRLIIWEQPTHCPPFLPGFIKSWQSHHFYLPTLSPSLYQMRHRGSKPGRFWRRFSSSLVHMPCFMQQESEVHRLPLLPEEPCKSLEPHGVFKLCTVSLGIPARCLGVTARARRLSMRLWAPHPLPAPTAALLCLFIILVFMSYLIWREGKFYGFWKSGVLQSERPGINVICDPGKWGITRLSLSFFICLMGITISTLLLDEKIKWEN